MDFTDIDECSTGIDECEQVCHNANGSYICLCDSGYALSGDGQSCDGTVHARTHFYFIIMITLCSFLTFIQAILYVYIQMLMSVLLIMVVVLSCVITLMVVMSVAVDQVLH